MANTASAKKNVRKNQARRTRNSARRSAIRTAIKKLSGVVQQGADKAHVTELLKEVESKLARAKSKGVMHRNTASRKLSRIAHKIATTIRQTPSQTQEAQQS
jgi:small subunit ribosomal protein S20